MKEDSNLRQILICYGNRVVLLGTFQPQCISVSEPRETKSSAHMFK